MEIERVIAMNRPCWQQVAAHGKYGTLFATTVWPELVDWPLSHLLTHWALLDGDD